MGKNKNGNRLMGLFLVVVLAITNVMPVAAHESVWDKSTASVTEIGDEVLWIRVDSETQISMYNETTGAKSTLVFADDFSSSRLIYDTGEVNLIGYDEEGNVYIDNKCVLTQEKNMVQMRLTQIGSNPFGSAWRYHNTWGTSFSIDSSATDVGEAVAAAMLTALVWLYTGVEVDMTALVGIAGKWAKGIGEYGYRGYMAGDQYISVYGPAYKSRVFVYRYSNYTGYIGCFDTDIYDWPM